MEPIYSGHFRRMCTNEESALMHAFVHTPRGIVFLKMRKPAKIPENEWDAAVQIGLERAALLPDHPFRTCPKAELKAAVVALAEERMHEHGLADWLAGVGNSWFTPEMTEAKKKSIVDLFRGAAELPSYWPAAALDDVRERLAR